MTKDSVDIRGEPEIEVIPGSTIKYGDKYITTVNILRYYLSELIEIDGVIRELMTFRRQVISNIWKFYIQDNTPGSISLSMSRFDSSYVYGSEEIALKEAKLRIDERNSF